MPGEKTFTPVFLESPYAGDIERNLRYLRACMRDCLLRGEAPYASHALYTQQGVLRDEVPDERRRGIEAGYAFRALTMKTIFYCDLGISIGMQAGIDHAFSIEHPVEYRHLRGEWALEPPAHMPQAPAAQVTGGLYERVPIDPGPWPHRVQFKKVFPTCVTQAATVQVGSTKLWIGSQIMDLERTVIAAAKEWQTVLCDPERTPADEKSVTDKLFTAVRALKLGALR
jgi:hypothetical protein